MSIPYFAQSIAGRFPRPICVLLLCTIALVGNAPARAQSEPEQTTTFAQFTDAHIFDDGYKQPTPAALRQAADDRDALAWAINTVNGLIASGARIDFLVYTGDLGLQNVDFPAEIPENAAANTAANSSCKVAQATVDPGLPMVSLRWAVSELADDLKQLAVRKLYFVPGNNDLAGERILDTRRYNCFLDELRLAVKDFAPPLQITNLEADTFAEVNGIRLDGLNSASFKEPANYYADCSNNPHGPDAAVLREACPLSQMRLLQKFNSAGPLVLFTHVPDLKDPYRKSSSWKIEPKARDLWEKGICSPSALAVFAGHFHDSDRMLYASAAGSQTLATSACVAAKTWVAPPLAVKNQEQANPQARGFLLATITKDGVRKVQPIWYEAAVAVSPPPNPRLWLWISLAIMAVTLAYLIRIAVLPSALSEKFRDVTAIAVVFLFLAVTIGGFWLLKNQLGIADSPTLIALLIVPLLLYGVVSGRLTEFSGPGGWSAKFREVARQTIDLSAPIDIKDFSQPEEISKGHYAALQDLIRQGSIPAEAPLLLTMSMGGDYNWLSLEDYLKDLSAFPNFKFVVIVNAWKQLVAYVPVRSRRGGGLNPNQWNQLISDINRDDERAVSQTQGVLTETLSPKSTNAEALRLMAKYGLEATLVTDDVTKLVKAIVERNEIFNRLFISLLGDKP